MEYQPLDEENLQPLDHGPDELSSSPGVGDAPSGEAETPRSHDVVVDPSRPSVRDAGREQKSKRISDRQLAANRQNAKRSTGPRTEAGKARSAQNAVRTGIHATTLQPIRNGPYAEDPEEFLTRLRSTIRAYKPRDAAELAVVERIQMTLVRLERNDKVEIDLLGAAGTQTPVEEQLLLKVYNPVSLIWLGGSDSMVAYLSGDRPVMPPLFQAIAEFIRDAKCRGSVSVEGLWSESREPQDAAEWKRVCDALISHLWRDTDDALGWAEYQWRIANLSNTKFECEMRSRAASKALDAEDRCARQTDRLVRQLEKLLAILQHLQQRPASELDTGFLRPAESEDVPD